MNTECAAKVNLRLRVFARDDTGFHAVETLLLRTDLTDVLTIEETERGIAVGVEGPAAGGVPAGPENLCHRAAESFLAAAFPGRQNRPGLQIRLKKRIPTGAGLGGGSSDAAGTLRLLAARWPRLETRTLFALAGRLGSDVPFGLLDVPMALGWERGRRLLPLRPPPTRVGLLVCPPFSVSTPEAYGWLAAARAARGTPADPGGASVLPGVTRLAEWDVLERLIANDLQAPVVARHPTLANALSIMQDQGSVSGMTGSGSALFAVLPAEDRLQDVRRALAGAGFGEDEGWRTYDIRLPN